MPQPRLIVFDLDYTLWDAGGTWCDCLSPPFHKDADSRVLDSRHSHIRLYEDVPEILDWCDQEGIPMALASRTHEPTWARELLDLLGYRQRFAYEEIYPSSKLRHFKALVESSGIPRSEMLFFDDEQRNIDEVGDSGCTCVRVDDGLNWNDFKLGLYGYDLD